MLVMCVCVYVCVCVCVQAICVRSVEGRRRVVSEVVLTLLGRDAAKSPVAPGMPDLTFTQEEINMALAPCTGASPSTGTCFALQTILSSSCCRRRAV